LLQDRGMGDEDDEDDDGNEGSDVNEEDEDDEALDHFVSLLVRGMGLTIAYLGLFGVD